MVSTIHFENENLRMLEHARILHKYFCHDGVVKWVAKRSSDIFLAIIVAQSEVVSTFSSQPKDAKFEFSEGWRQIGLISLHTVTLVYLAESRYKM